MDLFGFIAVPPHRPGGDPIQLLGSPHVLLIVIGAMLLALTRFGRRNKQVEREEWLSWAFAAVVVRETLLGGWRLLHGLPGPPPPGAFGPPGPPPGPPPWEAVFGVWSEQIVAAVLVAAFLRYLSRRDQPARSYLIGAAALINTVGAAAVLTGPRPSVGWLLAVSLSGCVSMAGALALACRTPLPSGKLVLCCGVGVFLLRSLFPFAAVLVSARPGAELPLTGAATVVGFLLFGYAFVRERSIAKQTDLNALGELVDVRTQELRSALEQLSSANARLQQQTALDGLTGAQNRRSFDEALQDEWNRARRSCQPLTTALVDIDLFKEINDRYGHPVGDACLVRTAEALRSALRRPGDMAARYGGDEFALLLPGTDLPNAVDLLDQIRVEVAALEDVASQAGLSITLSIGAASARPGEIDSPEDLVRTADRALYRAKEKGRNRVESGAATALERTSGD